MDALVIVVFGAALAGFGALMYSSQAVDIVRRHPFWKWRVGREVLNLLILGLVPEGLGLIFSGLAGLMRLQAAGLFAFIAANLMVLALWITRPDWAQPNWMRTNATPRA
jgi:hypothetical protein